MTGRRGRLLLLLALVAIAAAVTAVVFSGDPSEDDGPGTSAFDPSVPTSTQTPPPASGTTPPADPTDAPDGDPDSGAPDGDPTSGAPDADPTDPATAPSSSSTSSPEELEEVEEETSPMLLGVLEETAEIDPEDPTDVVGDLSDVATRAFLGELEAERLEFEKERWTRTGEYTFSDVEVLEHMSTSDGEVTTVRVCVDSSALVTRRADGEIVPISPASARAWNIFVLERPDSAEWRIVGRTFPDDPAC
ncbi:MAG: hypothetical protein ACTHV2_10070 [Brachybacterium sp.]